MWINNTAATLMLFPVGVAVVEHVCTAAALDGVRGEAAGRAARASLGAAVMLGIAYGASIGGMGTLVGTAPNLVFAGAVSQLFPELPEVSFLAWLGVGLPLVFALVAVAYPILLRLAPEVALRRFAFGEAGRDALRDERRSLGVMSQGERFVLAGFVAAAALWVFRTPLEIGALRVPGWSSLLAEPGHVHDATVAVGIGLVLMLIPARGAAAAHGARAPLLDWATVQERVPWGVLLLMGGGFALAAGFATPPNAIVFGTGWISVRAMARAGAALDLAGIVLITIVCSTLVPWIFGGAGG